MGITLNKHYSNGELFSVALFGEAESCCEVPCNCCDNESEVIQFTADYLLSVNYVDQNLTLVDLIAYSTVDLLSQTEELKNIGVKYLFSDLPPPETKRFLSQIQTYLL